MTTRSSRDTKVSSVLVKRTSLSGKAFRQQRGELARHAQGDVLFLEGDLLLAVHVAAHRPAVLAAVSRVDEDVLHAHVLAGVRKPVFLHRVADRADRGRGQPDRPVPAEGRIDLTFNR